MKYPNVVAGALAASAPIWQFTGLAPCDSYNKGVTKDFKIADSTGRCVDAIRRSWKEIDEIGQRPGGKAFVKRFYIEHLKFKPNCFPNYK